MIPSLEKDLLTNFKTRFSAHGVPLKIQTLNTVYMTKYILCKYIEYHSGVQIGTPPPPLPPRVGPPPPPGTKKGVRTRLCVRECGSSNQDDWRKSLALCLLCGIHTYRHHSQILYIYRAHRLQSLIEVHNWFLNQFFEIPQRSIIVSCLTSFGKSRFKPLTI